MADTGSAVPAGNEDDKADKKNEKTEDLKEKKVKTPQQIERERVRRRRRRQRKRMMQGLSGEVDNVLPKNDSQKPAERTPARREKHREDTHPRALDGRKEAKPAEPKQAEPAPPHEMPKEAKQAPVLPEEKKTEDSKPATRLESEKITDDQKTSEPVVPEPESELPPETPPVSPYSEPEELPPDLIEADAPSSQPEPLSEPGSEFLPEPPSEPEPLPSEEAPTEPASQKEAVLEPPSEEPPSDVTIQEINQEPVNPAYEDFTSVSHSFQPQTPSEEEAQEPEASEKFEEKVLPASEESYEQTEVVEEPEEIAFEPRLRKEEEPLEAEKPRKFEEEEEEKEKAKPEEESIEKKSAEKLETEELGEKKSAMQIAGLQMAGFLQKFFASLASFFKKIPALFAGVGAIFKPKFLIALVVIGSLGYLAYWGYTSRFYEGPISFVANFFTPKTPPVIEIAVNEEDLKDFGIASTLLFGHNTGSVGDRLPVAVEVSTFFGELQEPAVRGETGISAATFFGELKDLAGDVNEFVEYMKNLEKVQSLYEIDVYEMLDRTAQRDTALLQYLDNLRESREESLKIQQTIGINMDDLRVSFESLNPDKAQYESDFFVAMEELQAEKSDLLLKGFVDISQKQDALRARINALNKLATYYATALARLDRRIEAVDKNKEALIQGIRVVDIPGGGLDIIIKPIP